MSTKRKLSQTEQWALIERFIESKRNVKGETQFIKQSQPEIGVWTSEGFYPVSLLVKILNDKHKTNFEV